MDRRQSVSFLPVLCVRPANRVIVGGDVADEKLSERLSHFTSE